MVPGSFTNIKKQKFKIEMVLKNHNIILKCFFCNLTPCSSPPPKRRIRQQTWLDQYFDNTLKKKKLEISQN